MKKQKFTQIVLFWIQSTKSIVIFLIYLFQTFGSQLQAIFQKHLHSDIDEEWRPIWMLCMWFYSKNKMYLKIHIEKVHETPFECFACDLVPKTKYVWWCTLRKRMKSHLNTMHVIWLQKIYLKMHIEKEHEKPFACCASKHID